jgi:hypothetical protein
VNTILKRYRFTNLLSNIDLEWTECKDVIGLIWLGIRPSDGMLWSDNEPSGSI